MAGRRPTPTHLKMVRGNPGKRKLNDDPEPPALPVLPPEWLTALAREAWDEVVPVLAGMGVLTIADRLAVIMLCEAWAEWRRATDYCSQYGDTYTTTSRNGDDMERAHPYSGIAADAHRRIKGLLVEFGLTPAARSKVSGNGKQTPKEFWDEFTPRGRGQTG